MVIVQTSNKFTFDFNYLEQFFFSFLCWSRWNTEALVDLPDYMKICYLAMYIFANEMAYDALRDHGLHILPYLKNQVS